MQREDINQRLQEAFAVSRCEKKACAKVLKTLPPQLLTQAKVIAEEVRFHRRRYGNGACFCWPIHALFEADGLAPWPAVTFPRDVLLIEIARRLAVQPEGEKV